MGDQNEKEDSESQVVEEVVGPISCRISGCRYRSKRHRLCKEHLWIFTEWRWLNARGQSVNEKLVVRWLDEQRLLWEKEDREMIRLAGPEAAVHYAKQASAYVWSLCDAAQWKRVYSHTPHSVMPHITLPVRPLGKPAQEVHGPYDEPDPVEVLRGLKQWNECHCRHFFTPCDGSHREGQARMLNVASWKFSALCERAITWLKSAPDPLRIRLLSIAVALDCSQTEGAAIVECLVRERCIVPVSTYVWARSDVVQAATSSPETSLSPPPTVAPAPAKTKMLCRVGDCHRDNLRYSGLCEPHHVHYIAWWRSRNSRAGRSSPERTGSDPVALWVAIKGYKDRAATVD